MKPPATDLTRRNFLGSSTRIGAAAGTFTILRPDQVRGQGRQKLKAGIVGTGARGTQTIGEFLSGNDDVELVAMGDLYKDKLDKALETAKTSDRYGDVSAKIKVTPDRMFTGWDSYKKVLAADIDVVLLVTPPPYRAPHFEAAIAAKKHVFMEKPLAVDPVNCRKIMELAQKARAEHLTVGVGAQRRNQPEYMETIDKIQSGALGEILSCAAWWEGSPIYRFPDRPSAMGDVEFQTRNWYRYIWISGDQVVEQHLHNIDVINWVMGMHPTKVSATGGRAWMPLDNKHGNNYDHLTAEFTFPNGVVSMSQCRHFPRECFSKIGEMVIGSKGKSNCQDMAPKGPLRPKVQEHVNLVKSIRGQGPYINFAYEVAQSTMTAIMARESAYTGLEITWEQIMKSKLELLPRNIRERPESGHPAGACPRPVQAHLI